jgi:hypothetical protein
VILFPVVSFVAPIVGNAAHDVKRENGLQERPKPLAPNKKPALIERVRLF